MLKSKKLSDFNNDELKMYKTNIQINFTSSSLCDNENNFKVLMQLNKKMKNVPIMNYLKLTKKI